MIIFLIEDHNNITGMTITEWGNIGKTNKLGRGYFISRSTPDHRNQDLKIE